MQRRANNFASAAPRLSDERRDDLPTRKRSTKTGECASIADQSESLKRLVAVLRFPHANARR
jgi:hypothetical protein